MKRILFFSIVVFVTIAGTVDLQNLFDYEDQNIPSYITHDNSFDNPVTDEGATLGRVLFYDKNLSTDNTIACASCHSQQFAFSDTAAVSLGVNGTTGRHSMRLVNARFAEETKFFWDERAGTLELQVTMPIQDHAEMGYSGTNGDPNFDDLIDKLSALDYYQDLFEFVYGDPIITEERMKLALAQFVRSIQSFDSKFDEGLQLTGNLTDPFPNFTDAENRGKALFLEEPEFDSQGSRIGGGAGCNSCHRAPEFDIDPTSRANGVLTELNGSINPEIHRSPTLRDMINPITGELNGPLMHNAQFATLEEAIDHYNNMGSNLSSVEIQQLDPRLRVGPFAQHLNLTDDEVDDMISFLHALTGSDVYTNEIWSSPFDLSGNLELINNPLSIDEPEVSAQVEFYPNPAVDFINIESLFAFRRISLLDQNGALVMNQTFDSSRNQQLDVSQLPSGIYMLRIVGLGDKNVSKKLVKL